MYLAALLLAASLDSPSASLPDAPPSQATEEATLRGVPRAFLGDQQAIWTSPAHLHVGDLKWLAPVAIVTGFTIATDHHVMGSIVTHEASFNNANVTASNALIGGFIAAPLALIADGQWTGNTDARERGILGGEALLDGLVVEQATKLVFWRERPALDHAHGLFFQSSAGPDSSFPSSHSLLAWTSASVLAEEYPSHWVQFGAYTLATGTSLTRVLGQQHFPTDVIVGAAAGWLIGHYVYRAHHRPSR